MYALATTFGVSLAAAVVLTAAVRAVARRWGVIDYPDGERKLHNRLVPLWGGMAVYLAVVLGLLIARWGSFGAGKALDRLSAVVIALGGLICVVGGIDDCWRLRARVKLLLQVCTVLPIVGLGYWVDRVVAFSYPIELGWVGIPLTVLWLVGCINALNLLDGMDGLAATVGLSTAAMMGIIATSMGNDHVAVIASVLAGALAGFLPYNLPPASIFLGDSGSMIIGLVVGILGMQGALKTSATLSITAPAVVMTLPMLDTVLAVVRRKLTGQRFDAADRQHIHHRLLDRGLTPWQTLCVIVSLCLMTGAAATAATIFRNDALAWITVLTLVVLMIRLRLFGHHELALIKSAIAARLGTLALRLGAIRPELHLPPTERLTRRSCDELWAMLVQEVKPWRVSRIDLAITSPEAILRRYQWIDRENEAYESSWRLVLSKAGPNGRRCELCVGGARRPPSTLSGLTGLDRLLQEFCTLFACHPALEAPSSEALEPSLPAGGPAAQRSKAA